MTSRDGGTRDERILVRVSGQSGRRLLSEAARLLDDGFSERATTFLPFKISHALRFMAGGCCRHAVGQFPGHGTVEHGHAGCRIHARLPRFRRSKSSALTMRPRRSAGKRSDWSPMMPGVATPCRTSTRCARGGEGDKLGWKHGRASWTRCNNFSFHMAWHLALLHLSKAIMIKS
ncbi:hypothetical protein F2981_25355 (plasmid) [Sinorhizobium meliloti]|nr:hypothetical protein [Sinorhizobium meliloti]